MKTSKIISVLLLVFLLACSEDSPTGPERAVYIEGQTYHNETIGIELTAPAGWEMKMNQNIAGMTALLVGNRTNYNGIPPSFNLITENASEFKNSSELLHASEQYIATNFAGVEIESKQTRTINGFDCAELIYSFEYEGIKLKQRQLLFLCSSKLSAALTISAGKYSFDEYKDEFDSLILSLKKVK